MGPLTVRPITLLHAGGKGAMQYPYIPVPLNVGSRFIRNISTNVDIFILLRDLWQMDHVYVASCIRCPL